MGTPSQSSAPYRRLIDMGTYLMIREICKCEDYPCCGHTFEPYPMNASDARALAKEGKVKILGEYHPPMWW